MTPAELLPIANVCCYLADDDAGTQTILRGGFKRPQLPSLIDIMTEVVNWRNTAFPGSETLQQKTNFLQWLCTPYIPQAQYILNSGGSGQIVNPATGVASTIKEVFYQSTVGLPGTPTLTNGQLSFVITDDFIMDNSLQITIDNGVIPFGAYTDRLSFTSSYTNTDATINIFNGGLVAPDNIGLQTGMVVQIRGQKYVAI